MASTGTICAAAVLALLGASGPSASAGRTGIDRPINSDVVNAGGACGPALPVYDGSLRRRPLAFANEGTAAAFLSCSLHTNARVNLGYFELIVVAWNRGKGPASATCTLVTGGDGALLGGIQAYVTRTVEIPAGARREITWIADEASRGYWLQANFSCRLDPGVELTTLYGAYETTGSSPPDLEFREATRPGRSRP